MKKQIILSSLLSLFLSTTLFSQYNRDNLQIKQKSESGNESTAPSNPDLFDMRYSFQNLTLYPIVAKKAFVEVHKEIGNFTPLKDAISDKKIVISETGAANARTEERIDNRRNSIGQSSNAVSGTVNTLMAENNSKDTIFIMAGEVVTGGKQDRVIGQDVVIPPGEKLNLSAFCVEKNRWQTKDGNGGQFTGHYNVTNMDIRKTVATEKNQDEVWKKVDEQTSKNGASSATSAYTNLANSEKYQADLKKYLAVFGDAFKDDENVVGVLVASGDKILGCDIFATHDLFIKSYGSLIHSYIGEAITNGALVTISNGDAYKYLDKILENEAKQAEELKGKGIIYEYNNKKLHLSTY